MSIFIRYGNYSHDPGEVEYSLQRSSTETERRSVYADNVTVTLNGRLFADSSIEIERKLKALLAAYRKQNQDFAIIVNRQKSVINMRSRDTISGIRVTSQPSFPSNRLASHVTFLDYTIQLQWESIVPGMAFALKSFRETLTFEGGGPTYGHLETIDALPQKQQTRRFTVYLAQQSGSAVGLFTRPRLPPPIWPASLVRAPRRSLDNGMLVGDRQTDLSVQWDYAFESAYPLFGTPHRWGA